MSKLWISSTRPLEGGVPPNAMLMTGVSRFGSARRCVTFADEQTIIDVDHIIFCTGYQFHQPFIKKNSNTDEPLFPSGPTIECLHEHIIYIEQPSLAFLGMMKDAVPTFLIVQAQAAFVSRYWSDHITARSLIRRNQDPRHRLPYPMFMDYLYRLESLCKEGDRHRQFHDTSHNNLVFRWTLELDLVMKKRRKIREAFMSQPTTMTGVWSTADILHKYHTEFLTLCPDNIQALASFMVLYYSYKDCNESKMMLPFEGWEADFGQKIGKSIIDCYHDLRQKLEKDSKVVVGRGFGTLYYLISGRWTAFCKEIPTDARSSELEQLARWRSTFENTVSFSRLRRYGSKYVFI